jgi:hypothetical protein
VTIIARITIPHDHGGYREWTIERLNTDGVFIHDFDTDRDFEIDRNTFIPELVAQALVVGLNVESRSRI